MLVDTHTLNLKILWVKGIRVTGYLQLPKKKWDDNLKLRKNLPEKCF